MRLALYDAVLSLEKGKRIVGVKSFSVAEEWQRRHFSRVPLVPQALLVESIAQLLGWAVVHAHDFGISAILSMVEGFSATTAQLRPGFTAQITAEIVSTSERDSLGRGWITVGGEPLAAVERMIFSHTPADDPAELERLFAYYSGLGDGHGAGRGPGQPGGRT